MPLAALALVAQIIAGAGASARPSECVPLEAPFASNVWERAKSPALRRYCDLLAGGAAKLAAGTDDEAREALALADAAGHAAPDRAAPLVLRGRALARLGRWAEALAALADAKSRDDHALDDPAALLAWGRALARTGKGDDAEAAFRALLPRASSLPVADRAAAQIEAALLASARGPGGLDEATAVLRQARRDARDVAQSVAVLVLGLVLDRAGDREEARVVLASVPRGDVRDVRALIADVRVRDILADAAALPESDALVAIALEPTDPSGARDAWQRYLAGPGAKTPWADHARAHAAGVPGRARHPR